MQRESPGAGDWEQLLPLLSIPHSDDARTNCQSQKDGHWGTEFVGTWWGVAKWNNRKQPCNWKCSAISHLCQAAKQNPFHLLSSGWLSTPCLLSRTAFPAQLRTDKELRAGTAMAQRQWLSWLPFLCHFSFFLVILVKRPKETEALVGSESGNLYHVSGEVWLRVLGAELASPWCPGGGDKIV